MEDVHVTLHNINNCICKKCKSFPGIWRELAHVDMPGLFCSHGKAKAEVAKVECLCADCEVQKEHELTGSFYCVNGKAVSDQTASPK